MSRVSSQNILERIRHFALTTPTSTAIEGENLHLGYAALHREIEQAAELLRSYGYHNLGILMDNGPAWAVLDLAARKAGMTLVPIPAFFTPEQIQHTLDDAGIEVVLSSDSALLNQLFPQARGRPLGRIAGEGIWLASMPPPATRPSLQDIAKITYTSGTTGSPKGVCLRGRTMATVAASLRDALEVEPADRHLCLLPLAVLLENIGGLYVPLLSGATCIVPPLSKVGLKGAAGLDPQKMLQAINQSEASSIILLPQMLQALVMTLQSGQALNGTLRFIAVGGAPVSPRLLEQAEQLGLPVFEGYGLSECASVVAVNRPGERRAESVGRPLPHMQIKFSPEGEILLKGNLFSGYLNHPEPTGEWYPSGDLGHLDEDGYLYLTGRSKNCFITSFGRNVAPEWVERELTVSPAIAQAVVFGEARPFNVALIVPRGDEREVAKAIEQANRQLPDYAQVSAWLIADEPFSVANGQYPATGRPRRDAIQSVYGERIASIYENNGNIPERSHHAIF